MFELAARRLALELKAINGWNLPLNPSQQCARRHKDVKITMIHTRVLNHGGRGVGSTADGS